MSEIEKSLSSKNLFLQNQKVFKYLVIYFKYCIVIEKPPIYMPFGRQQFIFIVLI